MWKDSANFLNALLSLVNVYMKLILSTDDYRTCLAEVIDAFKVCEEKLDAPASKRKIHGFILL